MTDMNENIDDSDDDAGYVDEVVKYVDEKLKAEDILKKKRLSHNRKVMFGQMKLSLPIGFGICILFALLANGGAFAQSASTGNAKLKGVKNVNVKKQPGEVSIVPEGSEIAKNSNESESERVNTDNKTVFKSLGDFNDSAWESKKPSNSNTSNKRNSSELIKARAEKIKQNTSRLFIPIGGIAGDFVGEDKSSSEGTELIDLASNTPVSSMTWIEGIKVAEDGSRTSGNDKRSTVDTILDSKNKKPKHDISIPLGQREYGMIHVEINSDEVSPVWGMIYTGPLKGGEIHGSFNTNDESVTLSFNSVVYKGHSYPISAVALDPESKRGHLSDDIDHHSEKWLYFSLASFAKGWLDYSTQKTTIINTDGSRVEQNAQLDSGDVNRAAASNIAATALPTANSYLNVPNTIYVNENREIIIYFTADIKI